MWSPANAGQLYRENWASVALRFSCLLFSQACSTHSEVMIGISFCRATSYFFDLTTYKSIIKLK